MLTEERQKAILQQLEVKDIIKSQDLMQLLNASESTIRRDLQELEDAGLLLRVHGGAKKKQELSKELNMMEKSFKNIQQKQAIARLAAAEILEEEIIYLDAGSTTFEMIPFLKGKKITVVTNAVQHAATLTEAAIPIILLGGRIKLSTKAILGATALQQLSQLHVNKAFMGTNGLHSEFGYTTPDPEEAAIKQAAFRCSEEVFVLADHSKFNKIAFSKVADLKQATLITDKADSESLAPYKKKTIVKEAEP